MSLLLIIRRLHLYLGMFLLPWMIAFGASSVPLNHTTWNPPATWTLVDERPYQPDLPAGAALREIGAKMLADAGLSGGFYVSRPNPRRVNVNHPTFRGVHRLVYDLDRQRLTIEERSNPPMQWMATLHTRSGFALGSPGNVFWGAMIDGLCVALILWIASGVVMWWQLRASRRWGWLAIGAGMVCFGVLVATL